MNKSKSKKKGLRSLYVALSLVLLFPILLSGNGNNAEGAAFTTIDSITYDHNDTTYGTVFNLSNGTKVLQNYIYPVQTITADKVRMYYENYSDEVGKVYLQGSTMYSQMKGQSAVKLLEQVSDFQVLENGYSWSMATNYSYFALKTDGTVWSWGKGTGGQLAIGGAADKSIPTEVLDPSGAELSGVKKLFYLSDSSILIVKDKAVYLVGEAFGKTSFTTPTSKAVDVTSIFPAFSSANNFDMKFLNGQNHAVISTRPGGSGYSDIKANVSSRIFTVNGSSYTLSNWFTYRSPMDTSNELTNNTLIPLPSNINLSNVHRYMSTTSQGSNYYLLQGYVSIQNGDLSYWGTSLSEFYTSAFSPMKVIDTGVTKVTSDYSGTYWYLKNGKVYAVGLNYFDRSGIAGGSLATPVRITGPLNQIVNITDLAASADNYTYALAADHTVTGWSKASDFFTLPKKFLKFYSVTNRNGAAYLYGITEDGVLEMINGRSSYPLTGGFPTVYPPDYVAPIVLDLPTNTVALDKFNRHVVTVNYGSSTDIQTREYSVDGGTTWKNYTAPIVLSQSGAISFKARSGAGATYSPIMSLDVTNDPVVIAAGYPKVVDKGNGTYTVESGTTHTSVKVQVRNDNGSWTEYTGLVTLPQGSHVVDARILNLAGDELATAQASINGPTPIPTVAPTSTPVPTVAPTVAPTPTVTPTATPVPTVAPTVTPQPTIDPGWGSPIGSEDISFTVLGGGFSSQFNGLLLDTVTIGTTNQYQVLNSVTNSVIEDSRGTGVGWNYSLKITDFVSDPVVDNSLGTNSLVVKMPTTVLSVDVTDTTTLVGQDMKLSLNGSYVFTAEPVILAKAEAFQGMGQYQLPMSYMLRVPDKVEVVSAGSGSAYQAGAQTGLRVGTYRSQFTFTLASGI
ncbi:hypothetical protein MKZ07_14390 [Paenibacillus sp. FSL P4-0338]|uniref:hypothetical protein n=1 Tax=Paenibacillus sp. FSL P4-0338 TaxID=2921635 RepID=UPI0030FA563F